MRLPFLCLCHAAGLALLALAPWGSSAEPPRYFAIHVIDADTGRGVPLVELRTTNDIRLYTDSNGVVGFAEPGLMGQDVYFHVRSHGYEYARDGFGFRGARLRPVAGGKTTLKVQRRNVAERLYRITGQGIYRDSVLLGLPVPLREPVLNGGVLGQDGANAVVYRGKVFWTWGDTNLPGYPLGNYGTSGATSDLPGQGGLDPAQGVNLHYFVDEHGFSRPMVPSAVVPGPGPKWLSGLTTLTDRRGRERLIAGYVRVKGVGQVLERGLVVFDDARGRFERLARFDLDVPLYLDGHPVRIEHGGTTYLYCGYGPPYAVRVRADWAAVQDPAAYEGFTCLAPGARWAKERTRLDRDRDGHLIYGWKKDTPPLSHEQQEKLIKAGVLRREEAWLPFRDLDTGKAVQPHGGSVCWNPYRGRWVALFTELGGTSLLGEVWYAEADTPVGPWCYARKVATHDRYSFYNPTQHSFFDQDGGRRIYFEGTYSAEFSGSPEKTPRYDYNQITYRLDLADPRLALPAPVYQVNGANGRPRYLMSEGVKGAKGWDRVEAVAFLAVPPGRTREGLVPVYAAVSRAGMVLQTTPAQEDKGEPLFLAAADRKAPGVVPLYEYRSAAGGRLYSTRPDRPGSRWRRGERPVCHVWENPVPVLTLDRGVSPR